MSQMIEIPENIILDIMHLSCIGTVSSILKLWLLTPRFNEKDKITMKKIKNQSFISKTFL